MYVGYGEIWTDPNIQ